MRRGRGRLNDSEMQTHTSLLLLPPASALPATGRCRPYCPSPPLSTCSAVSQHLLILSSPQCPLFILLSLLFFFFRTEASPPPPHTSFPPVSFFSLNKKKIKEVQLFVPSLLSRAPPPPSAGASGVRLPVCVKSASGAVVTSC